MGMFGRLFRHLWLEDWALRRAFPPVVLDRISTLIGAEERRHSGELRFAVEGGLPPGRVLKRQSAHDRAIELFSTLRIWDTAQNSGVLIYVLLADRTVEIVADRGIHAIVGTTGWERICDDMRLQFAQGAWEAGAVAGLKAVSDLLAAHFPANGANPNELPDQPVVL